MIPINSPELSRLSGFLEKYEFGSTVSLLAGLLTTPVLQANTLRIELLVHLAVLHCKGHKNPGLTEIDHWLNRYLGKTTIASKEDPPEDVFLTNVETSEGNRRIFEGIWESNDYFLQVALDTLSSPDVPQECKALLSPVYALMRLSDCVAERVGLQRWVSEETYPKGRVKIAPGTRINDRAQSVTFKNGDLTDLGISCNVLEPFILSEENKQSIQVDTIGHTALERYPLVRCNDDLILALPHGVSPAIRRYLLTELRKTGHIKSFSKALGVLQAHQVVEEGLFELKGKVESLRPPNADGAVPSLHSWLLKYDTNKFLHVVLLHDDLVRLENEGLSSFFEYSEANRAGLEQYVNKVADYCRSQPDFSEGVTFLVLGGFGRGFSLSFDNYPDQWLLSFIRISDLIMLASELDQPITRYLKCLKQKEWAENQGFKIMNINGDYNFYCHWRELRCQLVPRELAVDHGSMALISTDMVFPVRAEMRRLVDRHNILAVDNKYYSCTRYGRDAYFKSMKGRPIYASLDHLKFGVLAGAIETIRGASWLIAVINEGDRNVRHFVYELWSGILSLYDRLIQEIEDIYPKTLHGSIEVRLNFSEVIVSNDYDESTDDSVTIEPEVAVNHERRVIDIKLPESLLISFQKPENSGEKLIVGGITKGLIILYSKQEINANEKLFYILLNRVVSDEGMRVLHLFHSYLEIDHLLSRKEQNPIFIAHEDYVFSKLRLAEGCTSVNPGKNIVSKEACNEFLHTVVDKIWHQLRDRLGVYDRGSVIYQALVVQEAAIQDRAHWNKTAKALHSLYSTDNDVVDVAQEREQNRSQVSLSARTIMEMAVCECPVTGGKQLSRWELDDLLAKVFLLVEVATQSDAINSDAIKPVIKLHLNGEYDIDLGFYKTVVNPFLTAYYQEEFDDAVAGYTGLYHRDRPGSRTRADEIFSQEFINAFYAEFGLFPDDYADGFGELVDLAVDLDSVVVETTLGTLKSRLINGRGLSQEASEAFLRTIGLFHRPAWDKPPTGYKGRDINPWRFRRRLSATVRPVLIFGTNVDDKVFYGVGALKQGFRYLVERSEDGRLQTEFFTTAEMKAYIGSVNEQRGRDFEKYIANELRNHGWHARDGVQMTELGGVSEQGDIDVLAWKPTGEVMLIECKRLLLARTVAEISEICRRFRGDEKDALDKHVRRVNWIRANPFGLSRIIGFRPDLHKITDHLVTNTQVPMMYLQSLPIAADKIGPLKNVKRVIGN